MQHTLNQLQYKTKLYKTKNCEKRGTWMVTPRAVPFVTLNHYTTAFTIEPGQRAGTLAILMQ